jgi:hypothetical protein
MYRAQHRISGRSTGSAAAGHHRFITVSLSVLAWDSFPKVTRVRPTMNVSGLPGPSGFAVDAGQGTQLAKLRFALGTLLVGLAAT